MTGKIERQVDEHTTTLRLIGHLQAAHLEALQAQLESNGPRTMLDLDQVTLVDVEFALHAHGSLKHWREVQSLDVRVSLTGGLYRLKGTRKGCPTSP